MEIGLAYPTKDAEKGVEYLEKFLENYINGEELPTVGDFGKNLSAKPFLNLFYESANNSDGTYSDPVLLHFNEIYTQITSMDEQMQTTYRLEKPKKPSKVAILPNKIKRGIESLKDRIIPDVNKMGMKSVDVNKSSPELVNQWRRDNTCHTCSSIASTGIVFVPLPVVFYGIVSGDINVPIIYCSGATVSILANKKYADYLAGRESMYMKILPERQIEEIMKKIGGCEVKVNPDDNHLVKFFLDIPYDPDNVV